MVPSPSDNSVTQIPRHKRLAFRAMLVVLSVALLMTGGSSFILVRTIEIRLQQVMAREALSAADRVADRMRPILLGADTPEPIHQIQTLLNDPKLTFIVVEDVDNAEIARSAGRTPSHLARYEAVVGEATSPPFELARPRLFPDENAPEAMICRNPVFAFGVNRNAATPQLIGYIVIGFSDPVGRATIANVRAAALGAVCIAVLVCIPLTDFLIRYLTRPIRRIARATSVLASGGQPPPLAVNRGDEIGVLARSFDDMARSLALAQNRLRAANLSLERQVNERTQELAHVNGLLRREIETKNEFLRTVSHDLSAPLRNIAGMTTMIQRRHGDDLPEEVSRRLKRITANVEMEFSMLNDLLELSRLRTRPFDPADVNLREAIDHILDALAHEISEREIECMVTGDLPTVHLEPNLVRQVFLNLIDNAIKYMGNRPERRITIRGERDQEWLRITVEDTGPGISIDEQERVFKVFQRGATSRHGEIAGRGIGLTSVNMVLERWGGRIQLDSELGHGSAFVVYIPVDRVAQPDSQIGFRVDSRGDAESEAA